jgi:hypothetical protein
LAVWTLINIIFKKILKFSPKKNPSPKNKSFVCEGKNKRIFQKQFWKSSIFKMEPSKLKKLLFENEMLNLLQDLFYFKDSV